MICNLWKVALFIVLQVVLKEATGKLEADLGNVRVQIGAESKVMEKLQQHAGKMSEQLEFVKV